MESVALVFLPVFINRLTETIKKILAGRAWAKNVSDEDWSALVLFTSLVLGVLGVVFLFPTTNLVNGQGAAPLAEQIVTGIIIGGIANGIDFLATRIARPETSSKATLSIVETHEATDTKAA